MFARHVLIRLKSNMVADFHKIFNDEVLVLLRRQKGFKDEITLSNPGSPEVITISLWENKANAEAYDNDVYPQLLNTLASMIDGTPKVETFEAVSSTFHKVALAA